MRERTNDPAGSPEARRAPAPAEHSVTINASTHEPPRFEALCLCGFASSLVPDRRRAVAAGERHIADERLASGAGELDPSAMRYPITDADGTVFDLAIENGQPDPFYDECPPWCENVLVGRQHGVESNDEDRHHFGVRIGIPVRSIRAEFETGPTLGEESRYVIGAAQVYLRQRVLHREATIWLGQGESGTGFDLALDEAKQIASVLLELVEAALDE